MSDNSRNVKNARIEPGKTVVEATGRPCDTVVDGVPVHKGDKSASADLDISKIKIDVR